jgi:hypothetical protein
MRAAHIVVLVLALATRPDAAAAQGIALGRGASVGPLVGSAPGANLDGRRVPTVGVVGDLALVRAGRLGLHVAGTLEHRAGAGMTGLAASAVLPVHRILALRVGAATGGAQVQRVSWDEGLGWRDWRGVDAGIEMRLGRTTSALMVRRGTMDQFAFQCPPTADCIAVVMPTPARRFTRVSLESRYALF